MNPSTYEYLAAIMNGASTVVKPGNIVISEAPQGIVVTLYSTPIITAMPANLDIFVNGWNTPTTVKRINNYLRDGWQVRIRNGKIEAYNQDTGQVIRQDSHERIMIFVYTEA